MDEGIGLNQRHILRDRQPSPAANKLVGRWGLKKYKWMESFLGWFVGLVVPVQENFVLPWLL
jgi:hypothetical protein